MAKALDETVAGLRSRPLDGGRCAWLWLDALARRVREGGRTADVAVVVATGTDAGGQREILGFEVTATADGAGWTAFLRDPLSRGLSGVQLVVSDDHRGLREAVGAVLPGASWQRCRVQPLGNLLTRVPTPAQGTVAGLARTIFGQPDATQVWAHPRPGRLPTRRSVPRGGTACSSTPARTSRPSPRSPRSTGARSGPTTPRSDPTRRSAGAGDVVGIFPDRAAVVRLVGAVLAEGHDEWAVVRRYMSAESLAEARLRVITGGPDEEVMPRTRRGRLEQQPRG
jgi:putative transposase